MTINDDIITATKEIALHPSYEIIKHAFEMKAMYTLETLLKKAN